MLLSILTFLTLGASFANAKRYKSVRDDTLTINFANATNSTHQILVKTGEVAWYLSSGTSMWDGVHTWNDQRLYHLVGLYNSKELPFARAMDFSGTWKLPDADAWIPFTDLDGIKGRIPPAEHSLAFESNGKLTASTTVPGGSTGQWEFKTKTKAANKKDSEQEIITCTLRATNR